MVVEALVRVTPQSRLLPAAVRAALCVAVPLVALVAVGRPGLALYATFGAFTAVYGRLDAGPVRLRVQVRHGLLLTAAVATGVLVALSGSRAWLAVPVTAAWAAAAAVLSDRQRWRPPGPLFTVFAVGACASVPLAGPGAALLAAAVTAGSAALAVALGAVASWSSAALASRRRARSARPPAPPPPSVLTGAAAVGAVGADHPLHRQRVQAARCAVAVLVAGGAAVLLAPSGSSHPYWAMVAAVAPMAAATLGAQLVRAAHRVLGTLVGLGAAAALLALPLGTAGTVVAVVGLQVAAEVLVPRHYGAAMVAITPLALLVGQLAAPRPVGLLLADRGLETLLGAAVGAALVVVTRRRARPGGRPSPSSSTCR